MGTSPTQHSCNAAPGREGILRVGTVLPDGRAIPSARGRASHQARTPRRSFEHEIYCHFIDRGMFLVGRATTRDTSGKRRRSSAVVWSIRPTRRDRHVLEDGPSRASCLSAGITFVTVGFGPRELHAYAKVAAALHPCGLRLKCTRLSV